MFEWHISTKKGKVVIDYNVPNALDPWINDGRDFKLYEVKLRQGLAILNSGFKTIVLDIASESIIVFYENNSEDVS